MKYFIKKRIVDIGMLVDLILHNSKKLDYLTFLYNFNLIIFGKLLDKNEYSEIIEKYDNSFLNLWFGVLNTIFY